MGLIIRAGLWGLTAIGLWGAVKAQDTANDAVRDIGEDVGRAGSVAVWVASGLALVALARWLKVI